MDLKSYNNFLRGGNIIEPTYDNFLRNTVGLFSLSATGGTVVDDAGFRIHIFTSPGSFVVSSLGSNPGTVEYVVVAGGGGGGPSGGPAGSRAPGFIPANPFYSSLIPAPTGNGGVPVGGGSGTAGVVIVRHIFNI